jgi:MFS family permease
MASLVYTSSTRASSELQCHLSPQSTDYHDSIQNVLGASALLTAAWFAPMAGGGLILAIVGGFILHLLPGTILMIVSALGNLACVLLFAIIPEQPNFWAYTFPAMICATIGVDIAFNVSNVFITTQTPSKQQGLAGALINSALFLGISFFLGVADIAVSQTSHLGLKQSYKFAFWFGTGCAGIALLLLVFFVRIDRAKSDLTFDEKAELEAEVKRRSLVLPRTGVVDREGRSETDVTGLSTMH